VKKQRNRLSYYGFDELQWAGPALPVRRSPLLLTSHGAGLAHSINMFRTEVLGLRKLRTFSRGANLLNEFHVSEHGLPFASHREVGASPLARALGQVPFAKMWSSALVPKPVDWKAHIDVVGGFYLDQVSRR
jgi:hypothetical protein